MISLNISKLCVLCYLFIFFLLLNCCSTFFFWCLLECNSVSFIILSFYCHQVVAKWESFDLGFFYFLIQSIGSVFFLVSVSWILSFNLDMSSDYALLPLVLKAGIFPFFFWVYSSISFFSPFSLFLLLSLQKIPLFLFIFSLDSDLLILLCLASLGLGSYFLFVSEDWPKILASSSVYSTFWVMVLYMLGTPLFFLFFCIYSFFLLLYSFFFHRKFFTGFGEFTIYLVSFLFFLGLPPVGMFFLKFHFVQWSFLNLSLPLFSVLWILTFSSLFGYFKFLYKGSLISSSFYNTNGSNWGLALLASLIFLGLTIS